MDNVTKPGRLIFKLVGGGLVGLFGLIGACSSIYIVDTGTVGVERHFREVVGTLPPGFYFVNPVTTDVIEMDVRTLVWSEKVEAYTKDIQQSTVHFTLNYGLDPHEAGRILATVGPEWAEKLVSQVVSESIEQTFGQYEAATVVAKRDEVARLIEKTIRTKLMARGVLVPNFQLTNIDFSPAYEKAVEEKTVAAQNAIREQNNTVKVRELANQQIETARGTAESTLLNAKANAESIRIRAEALANNPKLVELVKAERWDGKLPTTVMGGAIPFFNVPQS